MKKIIIHIIAIISLFSLVACNGLEASAEENYIALDLNEAGVQFIVNDKNEILRFSANNQEGEELLIDKKYYDQDVFVVIQDVIESALELGYLDSEATNHNPNATLVTTEQFKTKTNKQFTQQIQDKVRTELIDKGVWAIVLNSEDIEELQSLAQEYGITASQARIVKASQDIGEGFSYQSIQDYSSQEIARMIGDKKPIFDKISDLESQKNSLEDELLRAEKNSEHYSIILADLKYLERDLVSSKDKYDLIISKRKLNLAQNQEKISAHRQNREQIANTIKQSNELDDNYTREVIDLKREEMGELLK